MLPGEAELVSEWTGLSGRAKSVKRFERSNGLDNAVFKHYLYRYTGRPVSFESGKVTLSLHFRRCSSGLFRWITLTTMRGRWVGNRPTFLALVYIGGTGLEVCSVVSSERLLLSSQEVLSLWGSVRWRQERRLLAMSWLTRTLRRRQNQGQRLPLYIFQFISHAQIVFSVNKRVPHRWTIL